MLCKNSSKLIRQVVVGRRFRGITTAKHNDNEVITIQEILHSFDTYKTFVGAVAIKSLLLLLLFQTKSTTPYYHVNFVTAVVTRTMAHAHSTITKTIRLE